MGGTRWNWSIEQRLRTPSDNPGGSYDEAAARHRACDRHYGDGAVQSAISFPGPGTPRCHPEPAFRRSAVMTMGTPVLHHPCAPHGAAHHAAARRVAVHLAHVAVARPRRVTIKTVAGRCYRCRADAQHEAEGHACTEEELGHRSRPFAVSRHKIRTSAPEPSSGPGQSSSRVCRSSLASGRTACRHGEIPSQNTRLMESESRYHAVMLQHDSIIIAGRAVRNDAELPPSGGLAGLSARQDRFGEAGGAGAPHRPGDRLGEGELIQPGKDAEDGKVAVRDLGRDVARTRLGL
jgi:hypothetical protein